MTPHEARAWTLKEIIERCQQEKKQYEGDLFLEEGEYRQHIDAKYFAFEAIEKYCEEQLNRINYAAA
jgi:hypothetical protein